MKLYATRVHEYAEKYNVSLDEAVQCLTPNTVADELREAGCLGMLNKEPLVREYFD